MIVFWEKWDGKVVFWSVSYVFLRKNSKKNEKKKRVVKKKKWKTIKNDEKKFGSF